MSTKTILNLIYCNHMFYSHFILSFRFPTPSTFPSKLQNFTTPNESLVNVCVCRFCVIFTYAINDYNIRLLPTYIYLFMDAQNAHPFHSDV